MAQKVNIILVDDLDGTEASQTVAFGLDGTDYEIDLTDEHADELREALSKYVGYARKVRGGRAKSSRAPSSTTPSDKADKTAVREWAKANGFEVSERGRIPANVQEAFDAAQKSNGTEAPRARSGAKKRTASVDESGKVKADA